MELTGRAEPAGLRRLIAESSRFWAEPGPLQRVLGALAGLPKLHLASRTEITCPTQIGYLLNLPRTHRTWAANCILIHEADILAALVVQVKLVVPTTLRNDCLHGG